MIRSDYFPLQHHHHFRQAVALLDQSLENRRRDVIRKIGDDACVRCRADHSANIGNESIALDEFEILLRAEFLSKKGISPRSNSIATSEPLFSSSDAVSAPRPGPISTRVSSD